MKKIYFQNKSENGQSISKVYAFRILRNRLNSKIVRDLKVLLIAFGFCIAHSILDLSFNVC